MTLRLFMKPGCHLCDDALVELQRQGHGHAVHLVDISQEPELMRRYGERIPVLDVDGQEFDAPLDRQVIQRALAALRR